MQLLHVPFKGNADSTQALMGGHVMAQSDATGWGRHVDAGAFRLLVTFGEKRTKWNAPTAKELGIDIVSYSPYGFVGPKGMDPKVVKVLHDAFKKTLDDPEHMKVLAAARPGLLVQVERGLRQVGGGHAESRARDHRASRIAAEVNDRRRP